RDQLLGRAAPAARDRPRDRPRPRGLPVRRLVLRARLRDGRAAARGARTPHAALDRDRRRAARRDDPRRRPDPRARPRPHRRPRDAHRAPRVQRDVPGDRLLAALDRGGSMTGEQDASRTPAPSGPDGTTPDATTPDGTTPDAGAPTAGASPGASGGGRDVATTRLAGPPRGGGGHGARGGKGVPGEKALDFKGSLRRFAASLRPERVPIVAVVVLGVLSVALAVAGPKLLGNATNIIFAGVVGSQLPAGVTQAQAVDALRAQGQGQIADLVSGVPGLVPGEGIDFSALATVLAWVLAVYVGSFLFGWLQGRITAIVVQRTVYRLRGEVQAKLGRLPLSYFDRNPRGEILSRVTNDIDNISQTLTQTLSQLVTSVLTVVGV